MIIKNNSDLYAAVRQLSRALEELDATKLAQDLREALSISSLPGEVLGEIGLAMKAIRGHAVYSQWQVRSRVDEGINYIDRALGCS